MHTSIIDQNNVRKDDARIIENEVKLNAPFFVSNFDTVLSFITWM